MIKVNLTVPRGGMWMEGTGGGGPARLRVRRAVWTGARHRLSGRDADARLVRTARTAAVMQDSPHAR